MWQLGELLRAGWRVQIVPVPAESGRSPSQALIQFSRARQGVPGTDDDDDLFPITAWIPLPAFEVEFGAAVDSFYEQVFPVPDIGAGLQA